MSTTVQKSKTKIVLVVSITTVVLIGFYGLVNSVPTYAVSLEGFGDELPQITQIVLKFYYPIFGALGLLSLVSICSYLASSPGSKSNNASFLYTLVSPAVLFLSWLFLLAAMYMPAYRLG